MKLCVSFCWRGAVAVIHFKCIFCDMREKPESVTTLVPQVAIFVTKSPKYIQSIGGFQGNGGETKEKASTRWKFNSSPLKNYHPKRKGLSSNHHFSGASS